MKALKRYKYHLIAAIVLIALLFVGVRTKMEHVSRSAHDLPRIQHSSQRDHSLQLFPREKAALLLAADSTQDMREYILNTVEHGLPEADKAKAFEIAYS